MSSDFSMIKRNLLFKKSVAVTALVFMMHRFWPGAAMVKLPVEQKVSSNKGHGLSKFTPHMLNEVVKQHIVCRTKAEGPSADGIAETGETFLSRSDINQSNN